ncbi:MAG TPA: hypothetical protein VLB27_01985, partial [candidate division Zixibacteria bacterium]|nr:hypothetical protein [candidate division Zixibacteria bacterium]
VSPSTIADGGTSVVEGVVFDGATASQGQIVTFTVTPASAGFFSPSVDTSDANGLVASVFTATATGAANITASVAGGSSRSAAISVQADAPVGSGNITIDATNSLLLADGASQTTVTVVVRDASSNPAPNGTVVRLVAGEKFVDVDGNGYWSMGVDSLVYDGNGNGTWDAIGNLPATATVAGGAGGAVVTYTSGTTASTVYVKASVDDGAYSGESELSLQLTPNASINSIALDSDSIHLAVKQTGGYETTMLRAWCFDANGNTVPEGISVTFVITDGPGGGENIANLGYGPYTTVTNSQGVATAPISSGTVSGTVRIRASADTVLSNATQIVIDAGPAVEIAVGVDTCNIRYWRTVNGQVGVVAVVRDVYHNPVSDSTAVWFTTDEGQVMAHQVSTKDHKGVATSIWISGYDGTSHDGVVWVYAETSGGTVRDSVSFFNSDYVASITPSGWPTSLAIDGEDQADFTLILMDANGNPVVNGLLVEHQEKYLSISLERSTNQCLSSYASGNVKRFNPLTRDYSLTGGVDDGIGAIDNVTFFLEGGAVSVVCTLTTGSSYSRNSSIDDLQGTVSGGQIVPFGATVMDRFGNPLGDHTLVAAATAGVITNGTKNSNTYGEVYDFNFTAPTDTTIKSVVITVTDTDPMGNGMVLNREVTITH